MKEHGPQGFNPHEKLTRRGFNPYAGGGGKSMEGNGGNADNARENQPRPDLLDQHGRPMFPEYQNQPPHIINPQEREGPFASEGEAESIKQALIEQYKREHNEEPDINALRTIDMISKVPGFRPSSYNPPENAWQGPTVPLHVREEQRRSTGDVTIPEEIRQFYEELGQEVPADLIQGLRDAEDWERRNGPNARLSREAIRQQEELEDRNENLYGERKIRNVQDLAKEIMRFEPTEGYQTGEEFELINEQGEFQQQHFVRWVRHWMMHWHGEDPDTAWEFG